MSTTTQSELTLFADTNSIAIGTILSRSSDWLNAAAILDRLSLPDTESNRRHVRACAEELGPGIISGQRGYKHIDSATEEEVRHFYNWMKSQGHKMTTRAEAALARKGITR